MLEKINEQASGETSHYSSSGGNPEPTSGEIFDSRNSFFQFGNAQGLSFSG
jgi:hypothetical protein